MRKHLLGRLAVKVGVEIAVEVYQLPDTCPRDQRDAVGQVGDDGICGRRRRTAVDADDALGGREQAGGQLDECGLAAPVRAEQADDTARFDRQVDVIQSADAALEFGQPLTL